MLCFTHLCETLFLNIVKKFHNFLIKKNTVCAIDCGKYISNNSNIPKIICLK